MDNHPKWQTGKGGVIASVLILALASATGQAQPEQQPGEGQVEERGVPSPKRGSLKTNLVITGACGYKNPVSSKPAVKMIVTNKGPLGSIKVRATVQLAYNQHPSPQPVFTSYDLGEFGPIAINQTSTFTGELPGFGSLPPSNPNLPGYLAKVHVFAVPTPPLALPAFVIVDSHPVDNMWPNPPEQYPLGYRVFKFTTEIPPDPCM